MWSYLAESVWFTWTLREHRPFKHIRVGALSDCTEKSTLFLAQLFLPTYPRKGQVPNKYIVCQTLSYKTSPNPKCLVMYSAIWTLIVSFKQALGQEKSEIVFMGCLSEGSVEVQSGFFPKGS